MLKYLIRVLDCLQAGCYTEGVDKLS